MFKNIVGAASAVLLLASAGAAQANAAKSLSLSNSPVRAATVAGDSNEAAGGFLVPLLAVAAIVLGVVVAVDGDDEPDSN